MPRPRLILAACLGLLVVGCGRPAAHIDALPRPTGSADVLRFELAWGEDGFQLNSSEWRAVEVVLDEGFTRWSQWVGRKWTPFVDEIWARDGQLWQENPEETARLVKRAAALRREAAAIDAITVARIGLIAGPARRDAAARFSNVRRLEYASALTTGYADRGQAPRMPESLLSLGGLGEEAKFSMRAAFARTAAARAKGLEALVDLRFEMDIAKAGSKGDDRKARIRDMQVRLAVAVGGLEKANDQAVSQALAALEPAERARVEYQWLRRSSDPDDSYREMGDVAFDLAGRLRSSPPGTRGKVMATRREWEALDVGILEQMKELRGQRLVARSEGKSTSRANKTLTRLRRKRSDLFWKTFQSLASVVRAEDLARVEAFIRDVPDPTSAVGRLLPLVGGANAEAIVASIPPERFGKIERTKPEGMIEETTLDLLLCEPIPLSTVRRLFRRTDDGTIQSVLSLHGQYVADYRAIYDRHRERLVREREAVADVTKDDGGVSEFVRSAFSFLANTDAVRREFGSLDERLFDDLAAIAGAVMSRDVFLAREARARAAADLMTDGYSDFVYMFLGPGRIEFAEVFLDAGLEGIDIIEAEGVLLDLSAILLEIRERHRGAAMAALVATFADIGRRNQDDAGPPSRQEMATLVDSKMAASRLATDVAHQQVLDTLAQRLSSKGHAQVRLAWMLACYPELAVRFAPDRHDLPGEGLARMLAYGRIDGRQLTQGEVAVLGAMLDEWMADAEEVLDEAFALRKATGLGGVGAKGDWNDIFRKFPAFRVLDARRRERDARTARQVISILGRGALELGWVNRAVRPDFAQSSWASST